MIMNLNELVGKVGVRPKVRPQFSTDPRIGFDKSLPVHAHNFPLTNYTTWKVFGYKKRGLFKEPFWLTKVLPTGHQITPQICGLDGFFDIKAINQIK